MSIFVYAGKFTVHGEPVPKQSFRVIEARQGRKRGFVDARVQAWEGAVRLAARLMMARNNLDCIRDNVELEIEFHLGNHRRVDLDNLIKAVLDGMKGDVFSDDCQVMKLVASKTIDEEFQGVIIAVRRNGSHDESKNR